MTRSGLKADHLDTPAARWPSTSHATAPTVSCLSWRPSACIRGVAGRPVESGGLHDEAHELAASSLLFQSAHSHRARAVISDSGLHCNPVGLANSDAPEDTKRLVVMNDKDMIGERMIHTEGGCDPEDQVCVNSEESRVQV